MVNTATPVDVKYLFTVSVIIFIFSLTGNLKAWAPNHFVQHTFLLLPHHLQE